MSQQPFEQKLPETRPKVIRPIRYCEFRVVTSDQEAVYPCPVFACVIEEDMAFCHQHNQVIQDAIAREAHGADS